MDPARFFYSVHVVGQNGEAQAFLGTAFPVHPGGTFMTCRHVVDRQLEEGQSLALFESGTDRFIPISNILLPAEHIDLAVLPGAIPEKAEFLPMLFPNLVIIGESAFTFGYYTRAGTPMGLSRGYFSGHLVNIDAAAEFGGEIMITLPFPVVEGLSGSPVLTYHNGPKLIGVCIGSESHRVLASEVLEVEEGGGKFRETVHRIVEFGVAYHPTAILRALKDVGIKVAYLSDQRVPVSGLE
jgi:hypothetical protein